MSIHLVNDEAALNDLPDGTIISWLRIVTDETSEAVAFVRQGYDLVNAEPGDAPNPVTWISPGGWEPQDIETAGVTFPVTVIRYGSDDVEPVQVETLDTGGSYSRVAALDAAARAWQGVGSGVGRTERVLDSAEKFERWINR